MHIKTNKNTYYFSINFYPAGDMLYTVQHHAFHLICFGELSILIYDELHSF